MAKRILVGLVFLVTLLTTGFAQNDDPTLFTVNKTNVRQSEFEYIYSKTNGKQADFSKASLEEYLDLYVKFKLKVEKAKAMKLDTIAALKSELEGYRRQLADSYLMDREVTDKLVREAYERKKQDADISHIMVAVSQGAPASDTLAAYQRILDYQKQLAVGKDFAELAKESDDGSTREIGGRVGYLNAILPNGLYALESAAYQVPINQVSAPVRTLYGYHLVKVHDRRPARGEVEVAHVLIRKEPDGSNTSQAQASIQNVYLQLTNGGDFEAIAKQFSQDQNTAEKGGYIGFVSINRYEKSFEDAAFALEKDNDFSKPFETRLGWHIVRRISKREIQPFEVEKARLEQSIRQDERFEIAKKAMVERIKRDNKFTQTTGVLKNFQDTLSEVFLTFQWRVPEQKPQDVLFSLGSNYRATLGDYMDYLQKAARERIQLGRTGVGIPAVVNELYAGFVTEKVLEFEEQQLEQKYPDFRSLMREYEEGILLFEATKMLVWDKASQDTVGLNSFFKTVDGKYKWEERAVVTQYSVSSSGIAKMEEIRAFVATHTVAEVLAKYNTNDTELLSAEERTYERGRDKNIDELEWKQGTLSENVSNPQTKSLTFYKVEAVLPPSNKTLKEARGYVVADYQDYLEKQWVESLRKEFEVKINKKVLAKMTKK